MKNTSKKSSVLVLILIFFTAAYLAPPFTFANGGDQRIVDRAYMINFSRAPFTPRAGDSVQMLVSFVDLETNNLVSEDMIVKIRIAKLGGDKGKREFVYEQDDVKVIGGVLEFSYIFHNAGLHEIFFDFTVATDPNKIYEAPDFLLDVQKPEMPKPSNAKIVIGTFIGVVIGFVGGWLARRYIKIT